MCFSVGEMEDLNWIVNMGISQLRSQEEVENRNQKQDRDQRFEEEMEVEEQSSEKEKEMEYESASKEKEVVFVETMSETETQFVQETYLVPNNGNIEKFKLSHNRHEESSAKAHSPMDENIEVSENGDPPAQTEPATEIEMNQGPNREAEKDPKKLQRMIAKRQSAQRTRLRKRQHALELEGQVKALEIEVAIAPTRIKFFDRHNSSLKMQSSLIEQKIAAYTDELVSKRAKYENLTTERDMLTQLYMLQRQHRGQQTTMAANPGIQATNNVNWSQPGIQATNNVNWSQPGPDQLMGLGQIMGPTANMVVNQPGLQPPVNMMSFNQPAGTNNMLNGPGFNIL